VVHFNGVSIGRNFDCQNGKFINEGGDAILADGMAVKGSVFFTDGFIANGKVHFNRVTIGGNFVCQNGKFKNERSDAILADGMDIKGSVFLTNGFKANGVVNFNRVVIGGSFYCYGGEFVNEGGYAILADGMDLKGGIFLSDGFKAEGRVSLVGATVGEYFIWSHVNTTEKTILDLRNASAGVLWDDEKSWPTKENLFLDGFIYENIVDGAPKDAKSRIEWLNRQGEYPFRSGPYEQLAKVLEKDGHKEDAINILVEKENKITKHGGFGWLGKFGRDVFRFFLGYGYQLWRSWWLMVAFIVIGFFVFWGGHMAGIIVPMEKDAVQGGELREGYPKFRFFGFSFLGALVYSIDMFVPVLDLRMAKYWIPDANKSGKFLRLIPVRGVWVRFYMWGHIIAGWILTTLFIVGLTGLIK
jgi:hypothetical protein